MLMQHIMMTIIQNMMITTTRDLTIIPKETLFIIGLIMMHGFIPIKKTLIVMHQKVILLTMIH